MTLQLAMVYGATGQQIEAVGPEGPVKMVLGPSAAADASAFRARNVVETNVADLTAFDTTTLHDGVLNDQGDVVLLAAQTTLAENGPYVVGAVGGGGTAPLTRPTWWSAGATLFSGVSLTLSGEGDVFRNTQWASMLQGTSFVVDADDPTLYPRMLTGQVVLGSGVEAPGTATISAPILSAKVGLSFVRVVANIPVFLDTISYQPTVDNSPDITPGPIGTGNVVVSAIDASGAVAAADNSTLNYTIINQA